MMENNTEPQYEYNISICEPFTDMKSEVTYLNLWGINGWELISKDTVAIKKRVAILTSGNEDAVQVYNKFYWKRVVKDDNNGELGQGDSAGAGESKED